MRTDERATETASEAEVRSAIELLSPDDHKRLLLKAKWALAPYRGFAEGREPYDLVSTAILRTLSRRRAWHPKRVDFMGHLFGVIESLASHLVERYDGDLNRVPISDWNELIAGEAAVARNCCPADEPPADELMIASEIVELVEKALADEPELLRFARCLARHADEPRCGPLVQQELGISANEFHARRVHLRHTLYRRFRGV